MNSQSNFRTKRSAPTKAELEATVTQLKAQLKDAEKAAQEQEKTLTDLKNAIEKAQKKEDSLQQEIANLKSDLEHQKESFQKSQKDLGKIEQVRTELEKAKAAAIQLAQTNEKLIQEINTLKQENENLKATKPKAQEHKALEHKAQEYKEPEYRSGRPIQKESEKPADFATKSWLL